ncbi:hypothetical protein PMAYCL1PPCAC_00767, partial [Pristionchus mayeri]
FLLLILLLAVTLAQSQKAGKGRGGGGKGWKRSRPLDKAHAFSNLRKLGKGSKTLSAEDWKEHADQFCSLFPTNPQCRDGKRP